MTDGELFASDMTSDFLIYNILKSSDDDFISKCNVKFIDKSVPAQEDDTIYVASVDLETAQETFDEYEYRALVNVYVKTKDTDYISGSRFLRTVVKHIKNELKKDNICKERFIKFRNITYEYGSGYVLKGMHLVIQMKEFESKNVEDDDYYSCVNLRDEDVEIDTE